MSIPQQKATEGDGLTKPDFDSREWRHAIDRRNRYLPNVPIYDKLPDGWRIMEGATTQPRGTCWIATGSLFNHTYRHALMWL